VRWEILKKPTPKENIYGLKEVREESRSAIGDTIVFAFKKLPIKNLSKTLGPRTMFLQNTFGYDRHLPMHPGIVVIQKDKKDIEIEGDKKKF